MIFSNQRYECHLGIPRDLPHQGFLMRVDVNF